MKKYFFIICAAFLLFACYKYAGDVSVIVTNDKKVGSCHLTSSGKMLGISNVRNYKYGWLIQYQGCASEGLYDMNYIPPFYDKREPMTRLSLQVSETKATLFGKEYEIAREVYDSIFLKNGEDYFILVGKSLR